MITKKMHHQLDGNSIIGTIATCFLFWFSHVTKSDVAIFITIIAGITTIAVNVKKLTKK